MSYRGGPVLANVKVFTLFWGSAWTRPPHRDLAHDVNRFLPAFLESPVTDLLGEYGCPAARSRREDFWALPRYPRVRPGTW